MTATSNPDVYFMGVFMRTALASEDSGGAISIMEHWMPPGFSPPLHVHSREDQVLYVLEGELRARFEPADGEPTEAVVPAGSAIFLPRDVPHTFITGADGAKTLEINTPGGFEQFHIQEGEVAPEARIPEPTPPDIPRLTAAVQTFGGDFVGPPMAH